MRRLRRVILYLAIALAAIIIALGIIFNSGILSGRIGSTIAGKISGATGLPTTIGSVNATLTGKVTVRNLVIKNPDGSPLATIPEATISVGGKGVIPTSAAQLGQIKEIVLRNPTIRLVRQKNGKWQLPSSKVPRKPGTPIAMPGKVTLTGGTIDVVDEVRGATTRLLDVTVDATGTRSGLLDFVTTATGEKDAFSNMRAQGRYDSTTGGVRVALKVTNVSAVYAFNRLPAVRGISVAQGRADVEGDLTIQPLANGHAAWIPNLTIHPRAAEIAFPWLRRPVTDLTGSFRLQGLDLTIQSGRARVAGAPFTITGRVTNLRKPTVRLDFAVPSVGISQVKQLIPAVTLPAGLSLPSPARVRAQARGTVPDIAITGQAQLPTAVLSCLPWHDLVAQFSYTRGRLDITNVRAHGSPRQLTANAHIELIPGRPQTRLDVVMRDVPVSLLARCVPEFRAPPLGGTATITAHLEPGGGGAISGNFVARGARYGRFQVGNISADFALLGPVVKLTRGILSGPSAVATFSGTIVRGGRYEVDADLTSLSLVETLGIPGMENIQHGTLRVAGRMGEQRTTGHLELTLPPIETVPFRSVSADFVATAQEAVLAPLTIQDGAGEVTGRLTVTGWQGGVRGTLSGRLDVKNMPVQDWFPEYTAALPGARANGTIDLSGSIANPRVVADLSLTSEARAAIAAGQGRLRATYQNGGIQIREFTFESPTTHITATGGYHPRTGLQLTLAGAPLDLSAFNAYTRPRLGLALAGKVTLNATTSGPVGNPFLTFNAVAPAVTINDQPFQNLLIAGTYQNGLVTLQTLAVDQGAGTIRARGTANLISQTLDFRTDLANLDIHAFMFIADQSVWRRYYLYVSPDPAEPEPAFPRPPIPTTTAYAAIPRPLGGKLSAKLALTGSFRASQLQLTNIDIRNLAYGGEERAMAAQEAAEEEVKEREIEQISGNLGIMLEGTRLRQLTLADITATAVNPLPEPGTTPELGLAAPATPTGPAAAETPEEQGKAVARISNGRIVGNAISLDIDVSNLDLRLLKPWFPQLGNLEGIASVSATVSGPVSDPAVRASAYVQQPGWRGLRFEVAQVPSITWSRDVLTVDGIRVINGPMEASGSITWPLPAPFQVAPTRAEVPPSGVFQVRNGHFAPLQGMEPAEFDADFDLVPPGRLMVRRIVSGPTGEVVEPGIRGTMGGGPFTAQGEVDFPSFRFDQLDQARYDVTANLGQEVGGRMQPIAAIMGNWLNIKVQGQLLVTRGQQKVDDQLVTGPLIQTAPGKPLIVSDGFVGVPPAGQSFVPPGGLPITPLADIWAITGQHLDFRYGAIRAQVLSGGPPAAPTSGYLHLSGLLTADGSVLNGRFEAAAGRLNFPNGAMDLRFAAATITKAAHDVPRIVLNAEAEGQIGDYYVVLNPSGQVYPFPTAGEGTFSLGARSIPALDEPFILALLLGPTVAPAVGTQSQAAELLTTPWSSPTYAATITGLAVPVVPGAVALNYEFEGPIALRLRQRLFGRLYGSYLAPVSGAAETRSLALTYEITPRWSIGWSINALNQTRYQIQSYFTF